ncbi:MAG: hypothetical protein R3F11_22375 [Verrucomicrobiales bacterium]
MRNAYALGFGESVADPRDVSHNVTDGIEANPWAVGQADLSPGAPVPIDTVLRFDLDLDQPGVAAYLRYSLDQGDLRLMISSLHPAVQQAGEFVNLFTKDSAEHRLFGDFAPTLEIDVEIIPPFAATADRSGDSLTLRWAQHAGFRYDALTSPDLGAADGWGVAASDAPAADGDGSFGPIAPSPGEPRLFLRAARTFLGEIYHPIETP